LKQSPNVSTPSSPVLVSALKGAILQIFDIPNDRARELAENMAASGGWGTDVDSAPILDWS
jgi:hypothetical protein